ncbi:hypothetical protein JCM9157_191 [Halalkalibacter akibai JCM 9157]|uniref:Uncharacterized protein n=1 Tax=Halalkalibacter akibai (strain ATCC 43226 / DSM 21942 / CIP 109018 / JCM 9157 / 1139) TaxID=1236973 RepID=W4QMR5_HALA3|nr:hypothetical protein JCM9157_191 [Halalkalibacter akibai JCM 9157]
MRHIILSTFLVCLNFRQETWRLLPKFLQALLYIAFINSSYYYFFKRRILWEFQSHILNLKGLRIIHIFFITPLLFLLCMKNLPQENVKLQMIHIIKWAFKCAFCEFLGLKTKMIFFKNGWSIFWSWLIYIFLFTFGYIYTKRPLLIWKLSAPTLLFFLYKFKAPLYRITILGPLFFFIRKKQPTL